MAQIGTFTRTEDGFTGVIRTLRLNAKVRFVPTAKDNDKAPDLRGYAGAVDYAERGVMRSGDAEGRFSAGFDRVSLRIIARG